MYTAFKGAVLETHSRSASKFERFTNISADALIQLTYPTDYRKEPKLTPGLHPIFQVVATTRSTRARMQQGPSFLRRTEKASKEYGADTGGIRLELGKLTLA